jgi:hypothetical protein
MKKLDDIPQKSIFEVPEGYFDQLPMKILARLEKPERTRSVSVWRFSLRYALPLVVIVFTLVYLLRPQSIETEELLASIADEHLVAFLDESEISESELLEAANFEAWDADSLNLHLGTPLFGDFVPDSFRDEFKSVLENEL